MFLHLLGQQVILGNLQLFLIGIAGKLNDFHPVQQGPGNRIQRVGRGNEHHLREVQRNFQEVIPEGVVLLAVQRFQQRGGGIAPVIAAELIDLVQHQQRVHSAAAADGLHDAARHSADIRFPVAADVGLVPDAAQRNAAELPVQRLGNGQGDGGLSHARRACQTDDLPPPLRIHLPDGNGLQNPLLHLFQTEVIPVQHLPGRVHIQTLLRICTPGQFQTHVQIVPDHRSLRADIGLLCQLVDLLFQMLPGLVL